AAPDSPRRFEREPSGEIRFEGVSVRRGNVEALRSIDLTIPAGSRIAVVGHTSAGKSTLARLIPRMLDPTSGRVMLDGLDVRDLDPLDLRTHIGFVPQETFLFSATLAQNIAWGAPSATDADIHRAAELAGLEDDITGFPQGY